ncbi:MAG: glycosyltransferase [Algoriphagus sp.]|uniref:glycosyltransferase n=1 Tax=Algoriphagus sp. TaxID=1872435 RepID=UPI00183076FC|nr:glycosyltransferase [Algoriphagus sp.]NVJ86251.1 glycosyltransferase [Algoriphagus sp.]
MLSFYLLWSLVYLLLLGYLKRVWLTQALQVHSIKVLEEKVSLLVPIRNESENLPELVRHLEKIEYSLLEVIFIDDQSSDGSKSLLENLILEKPFWKVLSSDGIGKKAALQKGISQAKGSIIVTTDADCDFNSNWLSVLLSPFSNSMVQLVAGPVMIQEMNSLLSYFQQLDWASIQLLTGVSFAKKSPLMCSGASLAFRRSAFETVEGYRGNENWLSGDDEFLLKKIVERFGPESVFYCPSKDVLVHTKGEETLKALLNQRIRWAGKWKAHQSIRHGLSAFAVFGVQLVWIGSLGLIFLTPLGWAWAVLVWGIKAISEKVALGAIASFYGYAVPGWAFISTSLLHPFYSIRVGIGAILGNYSWKGRRIQGNVNFGVNGNDRRRI